MKRRFEFLIAAIIVLLAIYVLKDIDFVEVYYLLKESKIGYFVLAFFIFSIAYLIKMSKNLCRGT